MYDNEEDYDILLKILIIGDSGVGKSNLLLRFSKNEFFPDLKSTVGVEFGSKLMIIDDHIIKAQIWDTAGQERYKSITSAYYKGAKGVLIVYDISRKETFMNIDKWINDFKMKCNDDASIVIIGNKSDLNDQREVDREEAALKATTNNLAYFETSAKDNDNVELAFVSLMNQIIKNIKANSDENFFTADSTSGNNQRKKRKTKQSNINGKKETNVTKTSGFNDNGQNIHLELTEDNNNTMFTDDINKKKKRYCC